MLQECNGRYRAEQLGFVSKAGCLSLCRSVHTCVFLVLSENSTTLSIPIRLGAFSPPQGAPADPPCPGTSEGH